MDLSLLFACSPPWSKSARFAACLAVALPLGAPAQALVIDSFDTGQTLSADSGTPTSGGVVSGAGILGTERDTIAGYTSGAGTVDVTANDSSNGLFTVQAAASTLGGAAIFWDGVDGTPFGFVNLGLGTDLTSGGANAILVHVDSNTSAAKIQFNLYTSLTDISSGAIDVPGGIGSATVLALLFSNLSGTADLTNVNAIEMDINASGSFGPNIAIDLVETSFVPEPSAALLLPPALWLAARRRRAAA